MGKTDMASQWFSEAMKTNNFINGLPEVSGTEPGTEGTVTVHTFPDGSEILDGHGTCWTREEYQSL